MGLFAASSKDRCPACHKWQLQTTSSEKQILPGGHSFSVERSKCSNCGAVFYRRDPDSYARGWVPDRSEAHSDDPLPVSQHLTTAKDQHIPGE